MTSGLLIAAGLLAIIVGVWAAIERAWQMLLLAIAVALTILAGIL